MSRNANEAADAIGVRLFDTSEGRRDPYPLYHELRAVEPVHRSSLGMWFLTRYDDIAAMLRDPRFGKNFSHQMETTIGPKWRQHPAVTNQEFSILNIDGAAHTRLRRRVIGAFKKRAIDGLRASIETTVEELLVPYGEAGGGDLMEAVAFPLPVAVIGEILGVPPADRPQFRQLVADLVAIFELKPTPEMLARADAADATIRAYFGDLIEEKRKRPDDGVLSQLIQGDDDPLDDDEISRMAFLLFAAGFETTTNLIGNTMWGLLQHPDQIALLRAEPERFPRLPDEALRYDGTAQAVSRFTMDEAEIGGVKIPAGETVLGLLGAGNHDPDEFANPDTFDVTREKFLPLSFGGGIHFCLGSQLAKAEIEITFRELLERFDEIELAGDAPRFRDRLILRGPESLELRCHVADRGTRKAAVAQPAAALAVPAGTASDAASDPRAARPRPGADDSLWRNALRSKVEGDAAGEAQGWVRSGPELVATIVQLARCNLFQSCSPDEIQELAVTAYPISFEPGDRLTVEGAESLDCYVIVEGEADVFIDGKKVNEVDENDVVGERGPLMNEARSATVVATEHLVAYAISRERL
ncbi:MAG: cytochrome P450, partial [Deltaproteobacteria bacterium]|nr:cytochrome P450 [Deltaproteobacteria bacterium]